GRQRHGAACMKRKVPPSEQDMRAFRRVVQHYFSDKTELLRLINEAVRPQIKATTGPKSKRHNDDYVIKVASYLSKYPWQRRSPKQAIEMAARWIWRSRQRAGSPPRAPSPERLARRILRERLGKRTLHEVADEIEVETERTEIKTETGAKP